MSLRPAYMPPESGIRALFFTMFRRNAHRHWGRMVRKHFPDPPVIVLDCGCGVGSLLSVVERWAGHAWTIGIDISMTLLDEAGRRTQRACFVQASNERLPVASASVDVLFAFHVVEHLRHPHVFLAEASRVLRPGGLLVVATPNPVGIGSRLMGDRWMGWRDPQHIAVAPPHFWRSLLRQAGFQLVRDGTTGLSGVPAFRRFPLGLINWAVLWAFGILPWGQGEAYVAIAMVPSSVWRDPSEGMPSEPSEWS